MGVLDTVLNVFTSVGEWFAETVPTFYSLFYDAESGLTFIGVLSVIAVGIAIILLIFNLINSFLGLGRG